MNRVTDRIVCLWAIYCLTVVVAATSLLEIARGQEVLPPPTPTLRAARSNQALIADAGPGHVPTIVIVTNVPLLGHLFQNAGHGPTGCEEMLQRLGVENDCDAADHCLAGEINVHVFGELPHAGPATIINRALLRPGFIIDTREMRGGERRLKASLLARHIEGEPEGDAVVSLPRLGCPSAAAGECTCAGQATCGSECAAAHCPGCKCDDCQSAGHVAESDEAKCGDENCPLAALVLNHEEEDDELPDFHPFKLMQHIAGLMAEKAAAQAALEVRDETDEKLSALVDTITELVAENAALDAKLEAQAEHGKLRDTITELATENARLKAHVELAAERTEFLKNALALTLENERLKVRLAELEQKHAAAEAARTAAESHGERKPR